MLFNILMIRLFMFYFLSPFPGLDVFAFLYFLSHLIYHHVFHILLTLFCFNSFLFSIAKFYTFLPNIYFF